MCPSFLPLPSKADAGSPAESTCCSSSPQQGLSVLRRNLRHGERPVLPENHGRMSWVDTPTSRPRPWWSDKGRQIMWAWIFDDRPEPLWRASGWERHVRPSPRALARRGRNAPDGAGGRTEDPAPKKKTKRNILVPVGRDVELKNFGRNSWSLKS